MDMIFLWIFLFAWFGYWGWMLIHKPEVVKSVYGEWNKNMEKVGRAGTKVAVMGIRAAAKAKK